MTALRDAVVLLDHSLVLKKVVSFADGHHESWVRSLPTTANIVDEEWPWLCAHGGRKLCGTSQEKGWRSVLGISGGIRPLT